MTVLDFVSFQSESDPIFACLPTRLYSIIDFVSWLSLSVKDAMSVNNHSVTQDQL